MVVVKAITDIDVEPRIARVGEFFEPLPAWLGTFERLNDIAGSDTVPEHIIDFKLDGALGQTPEFVVGTKDLRFHACYHASYRLFADLRKRLLTEIKERK